MRSTYLDLMKMEWHPSCFCVAKIVCSAHQIATSPWVPLQLLPPPLSAWPCSSVEPTFLQKPKKNREHQFKAYVHMYGICGYLWMIMASQSWFPQWKIHAHSMHLRSPQDWTCCLGLSPCGRVPNLSSPWWLAVAFRSFWRICLRYIENHWDTVKDTVKICQRYCQSVLSASFGINSILLKSSKPCPQLFRKNRRSP